jgi:hypothetical protein
MDRSAGALGELRAQLVRDGAILSYQQPPPKLG